MGRQPWVRAVLLASALVLAADQTASAAAVNWTNPASGTYQTATNWSSNPALPGAADDVTINQPAAITVTLSNFVNNPVRSIVSQENFTIDSGSTLTVGLGGGTFNGAVTVTSGTLTSEAGGTVTINGLLNAAAHNVRANTAGKIITNNFPTINPGALAVNYVANGAGSTLDFSSVTTYSGGTNGRTNVYAQAGGRVELDNVSTITTGASQFYSTGAGSIIDLNDLTNFAANNFGDVRQLNAENGGVILTPSLTTLGEVEVRIAGAGSAIGLGGVTSVLNTSFVADGTTINLPGVTSYLPTTFSGTILRAAGAAGKLDLSGVTSFSGGISNRTIVQADSGSRVELDNVTAITVGATQFFASGAGSVIDLNDLTNFAGNNLGDARQLNAENGGSILTPNLTTLGQVEVRISGATSAIDLADVATANDATFRAVAGGVINLPLVTSIVPTTNGSTAIQASGTNSKVDLSTVTTFAGGVSNRKIVQADAGGRVELDNVASITVGATQVYSTGAGSVVDLNDLTNFAGDNFGDARQLFAENGGSILTPNLTTLGQVEVRVSGATSAIDLADVTTANNALFFAIDGGVVNLPAVTSYVPTTNASTQLHASGVSSKIDMSTVTSFAGGTVNRTIVRADGGGRVELDNVASITAGATQVYSTGVGSVVDLNDLTTFSGNNFGDTRQLFAENGGAILTPNLTSVGLVEVRVDGATSAIGLASLSSASDASFLANAGGVINLPALTSFVPATNASTQIRAIGTGSKVDMSTVTSFAGGTFNRTIVRAESGGRVEIDNVTSITAGAVEFLATGAGSVVDLSKLQTYAPTNFGDVRRIRVDTGGTVAALNASGTTTVTNTVVEKQSTGVITAGTLALGAGSEMYIEGALDASLTNSAGTIRPGVVNVVQVAGGTINGNFTQTTGGALELNVNGLTPITQFDKIAVNGNVSVGGTLHIIPGFLPAYGTPFDIITATGSVTGVFDNITVANGVPWRVEYAANKVTLIAAYAGDFDEDGDVDSADLAEWGDGFGAAAGATHMTGDANDDNDADGADFLVWQRQFGSFIPVPTTAVPEPAAILLSILAVVGGVCRNGRIYKTSANHVTSY